MTHYTAALVVGIIASATSLGLIISRVLAIEELHPYLYLTCLSGHIFWLTYGEVLLSNKVTPPPLLRVQFLFYVNQIGMLFEFYYIKIIMDIFGGFNCVLCIVIYFKLDDIAGKSDIFGPIAVVFGIIMYCSPLFVIRNVYKTKRVGYLSFLFCLASFLNGIAWFIYAFLPTIDLYLAIANGIGILLGIVQLGLLCMFREKPKFVDVQLEDVEIPSC
ncbi:hypothetical protein ACJIZ3_009130 [Penstemon smallii]|uniref:Sugar transporter SWEET1 n=1 Tax=Penstemon smallii TaxID=265156 RepID=A0ABD3TBR3_9LAMI